MKLALPCTLVLTAAAALGLACARPRPAAQAGTALADSVPPSPAPAAAPAVASTTEPSLSGVSPAAAASSSSSSSPTAPGDSFARTVAPVLARTCAPCHVPGGQMYGRLPFDRPEVVRQNKQGILRRLKVAEDRTAVERWLAAGEGPGGLE